MKHASTIRLSLLSIVLSLAVVTTGCLSSTHVIPRGELQRLAQSDPEARSERVKVVQGFAATAEDPPEAPHVHAHTVVVLNPSVRVRSRPDRHRYVDHRKPTRPKPEAPESGDSDDDDDAAEDASDASAVWLIAAAGVALGLAATEGARFNGWVQLHPMHPVHMYGPNGEYTWMPLAQIDPDTAAWAEKAFIREQEGPWNRLERAPLDRRGWNYSLLLGTGNIPTATSNEAGFMSHIQIGYFPVQEFGILGDIGLGWRDDEEGETVFDSRVALELQLLPLQAGRLHGGIFGQYGGANRLDDGEGPDRSSSLLGGGALMQLDVTTYMALTARAGVAYAYGETASDVTLGISIY